MMGFCQRQHTVEVEADMAEFKGNLSGVPEGFDDAESPRWQMVPEGRFREVSLLSGAGWTVSTLATHLIRVEELTTPTSPIRRFRIHGLAPGEAAVIANPGNLLHATMLRVAVKPRKKLKVSLNFVFDEAGNGTRRPVASGSSAFAKARDVIKRQTNLRPEIVGVEPRLVVPGELGPLVCGDTWGSTAVERIAAARFLTMQNFSADVHVFFVQNWERETHSCIRGMTGTDEKAATTYRQGWIFFQDDQSNFDGTCLAHEFLHFMGFWDHTSSSADLMYEYSMGGEMIHRAEALVANPG
jgi:hypothetical protein